MIFSHIHWTFGWTRLFSRAPERLRAEKLHTGRWRHVKWQKCVALRQKQFDDNFIKRNNFHRTPHGRKRVSLSTDNYTLFAITTLTAFLVIVLESCGRKVLRGRGLLPSRILLWILAGRAVA